MQISGRRILALWLLLFIPLLADVTARVDENPVILGEMVEYEIEAAGERVEFPKIESIGGEKVTTEGSRRLEWFEGNRTVLKWSQVYSFTPKKSLTIPSFKVIVDGKEELTKPIFLQVKPNRANREDDLKIELNVNREEAYVGESVDVSIRFKEKRDVPVMSVDFVPIRYEDFWVKRVGKSRRYREGEYLVHEVHYLFFPQMAGELTIGPAEVKVATAKKIRDAFGFIVRQPQWRTVVSKPVTLHVKPLPDDLKLVGRYSIRVDASPKRVEAGAPVTLTVHVEAEGNIDDFELAPLRIPGVTVYAESPKIKNSYMGGVYGGSWERKYVLIAQKSFTVPEFEIKFFDPQKRRIEMVSSERIEIEVAGGVQHADRRETPEKKSSIEPVSRYKDYLSAIISFIAGMALMYAVLQLGRKRRRKKEPHRHTKKELEMLQRILPYISESKEAAQMAENLYANLFEGKAVKVDRKAYERLIEKLREEK